MSRQRQSKSQHLRNQLNLNNFVLLQSKHITPMSRTQSKNNSNQSNQIRQLLGGTQHHERS